MSEIFTPKAKSAMVLAAREAILFKHQAVGTEHLLLGLILEQEGHRGKCASCCRVDCGNRSF